MMASRNVTAPATDKNSTVTTPGGVTTQNQTQTKNSSGSTYEATSVQNMTPESLAALQLLIQQLQSGGTNEQLAEKARRQQAQDAILQTLGNFTKGSAFEDAKGLMALNLQRSMEQNMPAIQRAIEGSGTSAGSMQALLAQNLSRDSSLAASALGAEQAKAYGTTSAQLLGILENATKPTNQVADTLIQALGISKDAVRNSSRNSMTSDSSVTNTQDQIITPDTTTTTTYGNPDTAGAPPELLATTTGSSGNLILDPNVYYSSLRRSGSNQSLYDFLTGSNGGTSNGL